MQACVRMRQKSAVDNELGSARRRLRTLIINKCARATYIITLDRLSATIHSVNCGIWSQIGESLLRAILSLSTLMSLEKGDGGIGWVKGRGV